MISHIGITGNENIGKIGEVLDSIEGAREEGLEVTTDVYPLAAGTTLRFLLPHWVSEGSLEELFRRLRDPDERSRMKQAMIEETARIAADTAVCRWDEIRLARVLSEQNSHFQGLTISEISRRRGTDPETTVMDLVLEERCQATMYRIFKQTDDLTASVVHPLTMIETDAMGFVERLARRQQVLSEGYRARGARRTGGGRWRAVPGRHGGAGGQEEWYRRGSGGFIRLRRPQGAARVVACPIPL